MKKYIGTKQIEAEPMTLGDFVQETGRNPYGKDIENHEETEQGYRVKGWINLLLSLILERWMKW